MNNRPKRPVSLFKPARPNPHYDHQNAAQQNEDGSLDLAHMLYFGLLAGMWGVGASPAAIGIVAVVVAGIKVCALSGGDENDLGPRPGRRN